MPTFDITAPDGTKYTVTGPEGSTEQDALRQVMAQHKPAQPSIMDRVIGSPLGRLAHDTVVDTADGINKLSNMLFVPKRAKEAYKEQTGQDFPTLLEPVQRGYQQVLERNRNAPGYAEARKRAEAVRAAGGESGIQDQILAPLKPAFDGLMGGILNMSLDDANAAADVQADAQAAYAEENPIKSLLANAGGGFMGAPSNAITAATRVKLANMPSRGYTFRPPPEVRGADYVLSKLRKSPLRTPEALARVDTGGKPITAAEAIGKPGEVSLGALARRDGATADALGAQMFERGQGAASRMMDDFMQAGGISPEAARGDIEAVVKAGQARAQPLYGESFAGGSIAPLKDQLGNLVTRATTEKALIAREIKKIERENPGALASRGAAGKDIRDRYMALHDELKAAEGDRVAALDMFRKAQDDIEKNTPGAVWSPRVQQFLDDPIMRQGINRGYEVQRLESLAQGRKFDPTEYGVTGTDEAGNVILGAVPNMRILDAGKRGLDEIIKDAVDSTSGRINWTQRLKAIDDVRRSYVKELDALNPRYKAARETASDYLSAQEAFENGGKMLFNPNMTEKQFADYVGKLAGANKDAFKGGIANRVFDMAQTGKLSPKQFATPRIRAKLETVFGKAEANRLISALGSEAKMAAFAQRRAPNTNSVTAEYMDEFSAMDDIPAWQREGISALDDVRKGGFWGGVAGGADRLLKGAGARWATRRMNLPTRNAAGEIFRLPPAQAAARLQQLRPREEPLFALDPSTPGSVGILGALMSANAAGR